MLSFDRISVKRDKVGDYYLHLADEDYYLNPGENVGEWFGQGAAKLGLTGAVELHEFRCLMDGVSPDGEVLVRRRRGQEHAPGWDLCFSAPKGFSLVWASVDDWTRQELQKCHDRAVRDVVSYIERALPLARRGEGGRRLERVGLVTALFNHGTSRELDPDVHTHVLLLNVGLREDGTTGGLTNWHVAKRKLKLGERYRVAWTGYVQQLAMEVERDERGLVDLVGVPEEPKQAMSKRSHQMKDHLAALGLSGARAAAIAAVETRRPKRHIAAATLFSNWREEMAEHGFTRAQAQALVRNPQGLRQQAAAAAEPTPAAGIDGGSGPAPQRAARRTGAREAAAARPGQAASAAAPGPATGVAADPPPADILGPIVAPPGAAHPEAHATPSANGPPPAGAAGEPPPGEPAAEAPAGQAARAGAAAGQRPTATAPESEPRRAADAGPPPGRPAAGEPDHPEDPRFAPQSTPGQPVDPVAAEIVREVGGKLLDEQGMVTPEQVVEAAHEQCAQRGIGMGALLDALWEWLSRQGQEDLGPNRGTTATGKEQLEAVYARLMWYADALSAERGGDVTWFAAVSAAWLSETKRDLWEPYEEVTRGVSRLKLIDAVEGSRSEAALRDAVGAWKLGGWRVVVVAPSFDRAERYEREWGVESHSVYRLCDHFTKTRGDDIRHHLEQIWRAARGKKTWTLEESRVSLDRNTMLVVLNAEGLHATELEILLREAWCSDAAAVVVGDRHYRPRLRTFGRQTDAPVKMLNPFHELCERFEPLTLPESRRQAEDWHCEAVATWAAGQYGEATAEFWVNGCLDWELNDHDAKRRVVGEWAEKGVRRPRQHMLMAPDHETAAELNRMAQDRRDAAGQLGRGFLRVNGEEIHRGDRVRFTGTSPKWHFEFGDLGTVVFLEPLTRNLVVRLDRGPLVAVPTWRYDDLELGYAVVSDDARKKLPPIEHTYVLLGQSPRRTYTQLAAATTSTQLVVNVQDVQAEVRGVYDALMELVGINIANDIRREQAKQRAEQRAKQQAQREERRQQQEP